VVDEGRVKRKIKSKFKNELRLWALCAHTVCFFVFDFGVRSAHTAFDFVVDLLPPVHRLEKPQASGGLGEDCLSTQCEFRSPACLRLFEGTPQGR
jgi:hypothetical protein